jgi:predicted GH43/DUF377 family glycosyl hydrolase
MLDWEKMGLVFGPHLQTGRPWFRSFAQAPSAIVQDDRVRVFFSCRPDADEFGQYVSYCAYVDFDRSDLRRVVAVAQNPVLPLGGIGEFDQFGTYPMSVVSVGPTLFAYYGGWTRCESVPFNVAIGLATSSDGGGTFVKAHRGPVLSYSQDEPFVISGPKIRRFNDRWYLWYIAGSQWILDCGKPEPVYRIRCATSLDGVSWERHGVDLVEPKLGIYEAQASPDVSFSNGVYHMFFCYRHGTDYRNHARGYRIGYACSTDLVTWQRNDLKANFDVSPHGWDSEMVSYPHLLDLDGSTYMFYLGNGVGRDGFGIARLHGELG